MAALLAGALAGPLHAQARIDDDTGRSLPSFEHLAEGAVEEQRRQLLEAIHDTLAHLGERATAPVRTLSGFDITKPVPGRVGSPFGPRLHPVLGYVRMHQGVDMGAPAGTPVTAAGPGVVSRAGSAGAYGNLVVVDHGGGIETRYAHLSVIEHAAGTPVLRGDLIGRVGETGLATGPHLHFELRVGGTPVDPARWLVDPVG